jgi:hypothetical protein
MFAMSIEFNWWILSERYFPYKEFKRNNQGKLTNRYWEEVIEGRQENEDFEIL